MAPRIDLYRWTSLRWIEKIWLCLDFGQLYALLWVAAQPWPWPYLWVQWTSWTVWVNIDHFSLTKDGALLGKTGNIGISQWGQMDDYLYYALAFSVLPLVTASPLLLWKLLSPRQRSLTKAVVLLVWQMLYLPCGLGVFRLYYCEDDDELSADPSVMCDSSKYYMYTAIATILVSPLILGLPVYMYILTYDLAVYKFRHDHEKRLQAWEIMYGLSLDEYWLDSQAWVMSSFKRNSCYFRTLMLALKLSLLLVFIFIRTDFFLQAGIYLLVTISFSIPAMRYRPFRLSSTNYVLFVLIFTLLCATTAGMMNAAGVENAAMVASRESYFLWALFSFALFLVIGIFLSSAFVLRDDWPSSMTMARVNDSNMRALVGKWISAMVEANAVISDCLDSVAEIKDLTDFNRVAALVRSCWLVARSNGSLFEVMLSEVLDKLLIFHKVFFLPHSIRRKREYLHSALLGAGDAMLHREKSTILMSRRKRGMLTKMTALRAFLGGRVLDDSFNQNLNNSLPRSTSGMGAMAGAGESMASLHIYEPDINVQLPSSDWGAQRDRTRRILENIQGDVVMTETVLQLEDPSERFKELILLQEIWTEMVTLLDSGHIVEADLPPPLKTEDCYTYRRLVEDCVAQFDLDDKNADNESVGNVWSDKNLAQLTAGDGILGGSQRGGSTEYGSSVALLIDGDGHIDLGSVGESLPDEHERYLLENNSMGELEVINEGTHDGESDVGDSKSPGRLTAAALRAREGSSSREGGDHSSPLRYNIDNLPSGSPTRVPEQKRSGEMINDGLSDLSKTPPSKIKTDPEGPNESMYASPTTENQQEQNVEDGAGNNNRMGLNSGDDHGSLAFSPDPH